MIFIMVDGAIYPLDGENNPITEERETQPVLYYSVIEPIDETIPGDDGVRYHRVDGGSETPVNVSFADMQSLAAHRANWREQRDPWGRTWEWEANP